MSKPTNLTITTVGLTHLVQKLFYSPCVTRAPDLQSAKPTGNLFSPSHWDEDNLVLGPEEINATLDEFRSTSISSSSFGVDTFLGTVASDSQIAIFLQQTDLYSNADRRWKGIPRRCLTVKELHTPMRNLIDAVVDHFRVKTCAVLDSFNIDTTNEHGYKRLPHFMALGSPGTNFGPIPSAFESGPSYRACTSFFELQIQNKRDITHDLVQLAVYARQCFLRQGNRRFVYGLLVTEKNYELYIFDRSGLCHSFPIDIHSHPVEFVRMILGIWHPENTLIGFDTSVYWHQDERGEWDRYVKSCDENGRSIDYRLSQPFPLFDRWFIEGRGTTCWSTRDHHGNKLLIKDAWRDCRYTPEWDFLGAAEGLEGVCQIIAAHEECTVSKLRGTDLSSTPEELWGHFTDRRFTRTVMYNYGKKTIENFRGRRELLYTFRDAVIGHQNLWNAGVLHGDIHTGNILLHSPGNNQGRWGILIDLDLAMWVNPDKSNGHFHLHGTREFASLNLLEATGHPQRQFSRDYMDDLESFYYVFVKICATFTGPGERLEIDPDFVRQWGQRNPVNAAAAKAGTLLCADYEVTPYFGSVFETLLDKLHAFFAKAAGQKRTMRLRRERKGESEPNWHDLKSAAERDYKFVLGVINQAIRRLEPAPDDQAASAKELANAIVHALSAGARPAKYFSPKSNARRRARDEDEVGNENPPVKRQKHGPK